MKINRLATVNPAHWGLILFVAAQIIILLVVAGMDPFFEEENIYVPVQPVDEVTWWPGEVTTPSGEVVEVPAYSSAGPVILYVLAVAAVLGVVLCVIPIAALKLLLRVLFASLFGWGGFIATVFYLPYQAAIAVGVLLGAVWFAVPFVWFHNLVLVTALASVAAVFGRFISPWTAMILILVLAVYDFLAVRFGFMTWMADKMARTDALPAIVIPRDYQSWGLNLKRDGVDDLLEEKPGGRKYSILGGGDIAFPGLVTASVYFSQGLTPAVTMAGFGFLGLAGAYTIQAVFLKGKAMPALPPIAACVLVGLLVV